MLRIANEVTRVKPFYTLMKEKKNASAANDSANGVGGVGGAGRRERAGALRDGHDLRARQGPREATGCMCRN